VKVQRVVLGPTASRPQNGVISAEELAKILGDSAENVSKCIAEYDLDHDGMINYEVRGCPVSCDMHVAARVCVCLASRWISSQGSSSTAVFSCPLSHLPAPLSVFPTCLPPFLPSQEFMRMVLPKDLKYKISVYA
jgi:hypothetical protein